MSLVYTVISGAQSGGRECPAMTAKRWGILVRYLFAIMFLAPRK